MAKFTYNPIYNTAMFNCSDKLTELDRHSTEMCWGEICVKNAFWPRIRDGRELCREIMVEYEKCSTNEQKMLNSRIPASYGGTVPKFVHYMMGKFKNARDELVDTQIIEINRKLEAIEGNTAPLISSLTRINKKVDVIEGNTEPSLRRAGVPYSINKRNPATQDNIGKKDKDDDLEL